MTLIGNWPRRASAACGGRNVAGPAPEASAAPRFSLRLPCLALPAFLLLSAHPALSHAANTPYQPIVERNVFGLKPPPPPPDPESLKPPPPKLTLTGIMTIFGKKQALLKAPPTPAPPPKPGQPAEPPKEHSYILTEGQREDGITVLQIDDKAKTVKLDADGTIFNLTFSTNETHTASAPGPGGIPSPTGFGGSTPGFVPPPRTIPRPLRIPSMGSSSATTVGGGSAGLADAGTMGTMGSGGVSGVNVGGTSLGYNNGGGVGTVPGQQPQQPVLSPEAATALIEANRLQYQNQGSPLAHLLPPTMATPAGEQGGNEEGAQQTPTNPRMPIRRPGGPSLPPMPQ